eukprot:4245166-Pyramimonas_sp.AAC.1
MTKRQHEVRGRPLMHLTWDPLSSDIDNGMARLRHAYFNEEGNEKSLKYTLYNISCQPKAVGTSSM